jgi:hypothetical protein
MEKMMDLREEFDKIHAKLDALSKGPKDEKKKVVKPEPEEVEDEAEAEDEDEEEEKPKKKVTKGPTLAQVKEALKSVLDNGGRKAAVKVLEAHDAEKVGDLEEESYAEFIADCKKAAKAKAAKDEDEDLDIDE